jgi:hypothetical protein
LVDLASSHVVGIVGDHLAYGVEVFVAPKAEPDRGPAILIPEEPVLLLGCGGAIWQADSRCLLLQVLRTSEKLDRHPLWSPCSMGTPQSKQMQTVGSLWPVSGRSADPSHTHSCPA